MLYEKFVLENAEVFGRRLKMVQDIAKILDHPLAQVQKEGREWTGPDDERRRILKGFFAVCFEVGLFVPRTEDVYWCNGSETFLKYCIPPCLSPVGAFRPVNVLIVDDTAYELLKSAYALIGIPNVTVDFYHCILDREVVKKVTRDEVLEKFCQGILS